MALRELQIVVKYAPVNFNNRNKSCRTCDAVIFTYLKIWSRGGRGGATCPLPSEGLRHSWVDLRRVEALMLSLNGPIETIFPRAQTVHIRNFSHRL